MDKQIASKLKLARHMAGLSQVEAARAMGMSQTIIFRIEAFKRKVSKEELQRFSKLYSLPIEFFKSELPLEKILQKELKG